MIAPDHKSPLEHKTLPCEVKAAGEDGSFELYALAFNNIDRVGDVIVPGAVSNVDELVRDGWGALNHSNMSLPVAYAEGAEQDGKGLLVRGKFHTHPDAQAVRSVVRERMAAGKSVPCSIGYAVDDAGYEMRGGQQVRILKSIRVYEFSFVNLPANPAAGVVSAKSLGADPMDATETGFIASLRAALGLDTKKGRAISAANHEALTGHAAAMADALAKVHEQHKSMKASHKDMGDRIDELKAFLAGHAPAGADEGDGPDDEGEKAAEAPPPAAEAPPPATKTLAERREAVARRLAVMQSLDP